MLPGVTLPSLLCRLGPGPGPRVEGSWCFSSLGSLAPWPVRQRVRTPRLSLWPRRGCGAVRGLRSGQVESGRRGRKLGCWAVPSPPPPEERACRHVTRWVGEKPHRRAVPELDPGLWLRGARAAGEERPSLLCPLLYTEPGPRVSRGLRRRVEPRGCHKLPMGRPLLTAETQMQGDSQWGRGPDRNLP